MKKDIKLIAFDIDGTLVNSKGQVLEESKKLVADLKAAGYKVVLCTGRPFNGYWWIREDLGLMDDGDLSIASTGAHIRENATGKGLVNHTLTPSDIEKIESLIDDPRIEFSIYTRDIIYNKSKKPSKEFFDDKKTNMMAWLRYENLSDIKEDLTRACYIGSPEALADFEKRHKSELEKDFKYMRNETIIGEILNKKAGKSEAMTSLCQMLGLSLDQVMYFGDGANDVKTIKAAGVGVAMANAAKPCKEVADYVIGDNDHPSIADFARKYLDLDE